MLSRLLPLFAAFAVALPAAADEVVATEKPVLMPANTGKPDAFTVPPGFQVERIYSVPKEKYGSWVSITTDPKGRLIASDQEKKGLYRITPRQGRHRRAGEGREARRRRSPPPRGCCSPSTACTSSVNGGPGSGLYRIPYDTARQVRRGREAQGRSRAAASTGRTPCGCRPDGKSILLVCGNHTQPPENFEHSRLPKNWGEDHLLPRQWDANGHARGILAPGGWVAKTDPDGKTWEIMTSGYRNTYDFAFNADGEMFVYDADMEWDMGIAVVSADPRLPRDQRQRVRLAQRHRQVAAVLRR